MTPLSITPLFISSLLLFCAAPSMAQTCKAYIPDNTPDSRYTNHQDGTVTDNDTGLMWKQCLEGQSGINICTGTPIAYTWKAALQWGDTAGFANYNDWRLPNIKELASLVSNNCIEPTINRNLFPKSPSNILWSSAPTVPGGAWVHGFYYAHRDSFGYGSNLGVRLVRSGQ